MIPFHIWLSNLCLGSRVSNIVSCLIYDVTKNPPVIQTTARFVCFAASTGVHRNFCQKVLNHCVVVKLRCLWCCKIVRFVPMWSGELWIECYVGLCIVVNYLSWVCVHKGQLLTALERRDGSPTIFGYWKQRSSSHRYCFFCHTLYQVRDLYYVLPLL